MRTIAVFIVAVLLLSSVVTTAFAESVFQQMYDGIKSWGQSSSQTKASK